MRPSRVLAARRKIAPHDATKNIPGRFPGERWSGDDYSGSLANHIAKGGNVVVRVLPSLLATLRVLRCRSLTRRARVVGGETYIC
jgi:hypothetical protein